MANEEYKAKAKERLSKRDAARADERRKEDVLNSRELTTCSCI